MGLPTHQLAREGRQGSSSTCEQSNDCPTDKTTFPHHLWKINA